MADTSNLITTQTAAADLGIPHRRVLFLIDNGRLPAIKVGRDWLISRSDLELVRGKTVYKRRLTQEETREIQERHQRGESIESLVDRFSVARATIYRHLNRK